MAEPSLYALACDLLGGDLDEDERPSVPEAAARCPRAGVVAAREGDQDMVVFALADGRTFAAPDRCPHDGGRLSDGFVDGERLVCARHGWDFDARTGRCPGRPRAIIPVREVRRRAGG